MDINKVNSIRTTEYDQRSFWCIGFHHACDTKSIDKINNFRIKYDFFTMKLLSYVIVGMYILRIARRNRLDF